MTTLRLCALFSLLLGLAAPHVQGSTGWLDASQFDSIQQAIDALPETGGEVYIPAGRYELERPLLVGDYVTLRGAGESTVLVAREKLNTYFQEQNAFGQTPEHGILFNPMYRHAAAIKNASEQGNRSIRIERLRIISDRTTARLATGIMLSNTQRAHIEDVTIEGFGASGIVMLNGRDSSVIRCFLENNHNGVLIKGDKDHSRNLLIQGNTVRANRWTGIYVAGGGTHHSGGELIDGPVGLTITHNTVEEHMTDAGVKIRGAQQVVLSGNRLDQALESGIESNGTHDMVCTGNIVTRVDDGMNSKGNGCGIYFGRLSRRGNLIVSDNLVTQSTFGIWSETISAKGTQQFAGGMAVVGNLTQGNVAFGLGGAGLTDGAWVGNVAIDNGQHRPDASSDTGGMIFTAGSKRLTVVGNLINDARATDNRLMKHGMIIRGAQQTLAGMNFIDGAFDQNFRTIANEGLEQHNNLIGSENATK